MDILYICWLNGTFTTEMKKTLTSVKQLLAHSAHRQEGEKLWRTGVAHVIRNLCRE